MAPAIPVIDGRLGYTYDTIMTCSLGGNGCEKEGCMDATATRDRGNPAEQSGATLRTVAIASLVGTTIEWYDFFIFSSLLPVVFNKLFFPAGDQLLADLLAYGIFAAGFIVRPLGGIVFGHFGDRIGRKRLLVFSLALMGAGTFLIGILPTYTQAGAWAPIVLLSLRVVQGVALGGEWGGAVLLTFEFAEPRRRALYSSIPQIGLALGLCLGTGSVALLSGSLSNNAFLSWGWRLPFLASVLLLGIGLYIRSRVAETPAFEHLKQTGRIAPVPIADVLSRHKSAIILGLGANLVMGVVFAVYTVYGLALMVRSGSISRTSSLAVVTISAVALLFTIPLTAMLADRFGKKIVYISASIASAVVAFPILWAMVYSMSPLLAGLAVFIGFGILWGPLYGLQSSICCELFDARLRYTGISLVYQLGSVFSVSLTPFVATSLFGIGNDMPWLIGVYLVVAAGVSALCVGLMRFRRDDPEIPTPARPIT
jgi:MHS family shikimate/dehydroshikimate transporter-like MFS transporter